MFLGGIEAQAAALDARWPGYNRAEVPRCETIG
jgi:hypothetical protein